ncbi:MAG: hypothetical protein ACRC5C_03460 [Bacilli bacterium]
MNIVLAYLQLNMRMILKEWITFVWSLLFPAIVLFMNREYISQQEQLHMYWSFIILSSYLYGVGVHAVRLRETGVLKTYFSIREANYEFFFANVLTQMIYCSIALLLFNSIATLLLDFSLVSLVVQSVMLIALGVPFAFFTMLISLVRRVNTSNLITLVNIGVYLTFVAIFYIDSTYNPIIIFGKTLQIESVTDFVAYIVSCMLFVAIGHLCIKNYRVLPVGRR